MQMLLTIQGMLLPNHYVGSNFQFGCRVSPIRMTAKFGTYKKLLFHFEQFTIEKLWEIRNIGIFAAN
jgi:hypothetical protein